MMINLRKIFTSCSWRNTNSIKKVIFRWLCFPRVVQKQMLG